MKLQIIGYVVIAIFYFGLFNLSFSEENVGSAKAKACEEYTTSLARDIIDAREKGILNTLKDNKEVIGSTEVSQMILNHMLYMAEKLQSITKAELRADGYSYCLGLVR